LTEPRSCPACRLPGASSSLGNVGGFDMRVCGRCKSIFTDRLPAHEEASDYGAFYAEASDVPVPAFVLGRLEETVSSFEPYRMRNRWLDVGCGIGTLLRAVQNRGWDATGTEVAPAAVESVRAAGMDARLGVLGDLDLPEAGFDVVSMVEVIEHVPDPDSLVADARRLLRPGGALYITTPNGRSLSARMLGARWSVVTPPDHLQLFSVSGLHATLARAGLVVRSVATNGINPYELAAGLRSGRERAHGASNTETSYRLNESLTTRRTGKLVKGAANAVLSAGRVGNTVKLVAETRG
jgi:SAM-dependent methyltransferase